MFKRTLSALLLVALVAGCGSAKPADAPKPGATEGPKPAEATAKPAEPPKAAETKYPITLKDGSGRDVTIAGEPKRILSIAPSNTELLFALGKGSALVGRTDWCDYPAEAKSMPSIGGLQKPNFEQIVSLKPDLVLMMSGNDKVREQLEKDHKLTVYVVNPENFTDLYAGVKQLGVAINAQAKAEAVVTEMQKEVKAITDKVAGATAKPKVFYEVGYDPQLFTAGSGTFIDDMIKLAGGVNAAGDLKGWTPFSLEQLAAANPEILLSGYEPVEKVKTRAGWDSFKAVKESKVYLVPDVNTVVRPGPRLVQGLKWFAQTLHPELFK